MIRGWHALLFAAVLAGCGGEPVEVPLDVLVRHQADFDGRNVRTEGYLRSHPDPLHYWIEDAALQRVGLTVDDARVEAHVDARVVVEGRFSHAPDRGRRIAVARVEGVD